MSSDMDIEQQPALDRDVADDLNSSAEDEKTILEPSEERRLVKSVEVTKKMKKGDTYYVIESVWFKKWKDYVNYNEYLSADGSSRPGPIENGNLLDGTDQLKKNVHERWEYEVICEDSWRLLFKWYGGGPAIPRTVIASRSEYNLVVEVRPLTLKMVRSSDPQKTEHLVYYSRVDTVGKLKTDMVAKFNLDPEKFRLWDYHASRKIKMLTVSSEKLEDAQIIDFQLVLIEEQVDGKWPPDPTPTYYSNSYNYSQPPSHPGLVGLNNLGNTCFMNSALQCLSNTVPLVQFLLSDRFKEDINETNPLGTGGQLTEEFSKLLKDIWTGNSNMVAPREFKYKLERFAPQFQGYNQHDSQELLAFLLDGLHEDLNRIKKKPYVATIEAEGRPDTEVAEESWKGHRSRNDSFIVDWFQAQLKSTLICPIETCKKISVTFDPFMYLSLPLPIKNTRVITFTLVYLDTARLPVKYHIKINKYATINDLKTAISELVEHKIQPENIVLTDVYGNRFFKEFKDTLDSIQDRDVVVGFEIQPQTPKAPEGQIPNEPEIVYLPLLNRKEEVYTFTQYSASTYVSKPLFGNPQVLSLQKKVTARQVYEAVQNKLSRFIKKDVEAENQDPNKNPYFVVKVVRKVSYTEEEVDLPLNDDVVELQDRQNLVAFWSNWAVTNAYNVAAEKEVEEHSSCSLTEESEESSLSLQTSVDLFTVQEQLGPDDPWYCNRCKEHRQAYKKFDIWTLPPILVIHLKRFSYKNRYFRDKIESLVNFPINGLDFSPHVLGGDKSIPAIYDLYAISNHYGSLGGGHYTAFAKNNVTNKWYRFDDSSVSEVAESVIVTPAAYILFYIRRDVAEQFKQQQQQQQPQATESSSEAAPSTTTTTTTSSSVSDVSTTTTTTTTSNVTTPAAAADA